MYINWNDYELLYLIKENNDLAKNVFYQKYSYLIYKFYKEHFIAWIPFQDYLQEGLMALDKAIYKFNDSLNIHFYFYFYSVLFNLTTRLNKKNQLNEARILYLDREPIVLPQTKKIYMIKKSLECMDSIYLELFDFCIVWGGSLTSFCQERGLSYYQTYRSYKKLIVEVEKILTKWLE